jgi:hypothetical protein
MASFDAQGIAGNRKQPHLFLIIAAVRLKIARPWWIWREHFPKR